MARSVSKRKLKCLFCGNKDVTKNKSGSRTFHECPTCGKIDELHVKEVSD